MKYEVIPVTPFQQNCSLIWCEETGRAAVVDPGGDVDRVLRAAERRRLAIERILVTHGHIDHAGATADIAQQLGVPVEGPHRDDAFWIESIPEQSRRFGFTPLRSFTPDRWLAQGDAVRFGAVQLEVRHCPGHTPGHVIFFNCGDRLALVGDVLFHGSIGRTDLPGGDYDTLIRSITEQLWPLGDDVTFIPGHGPLSTFGEEREINPFVADEVLARL